MKWRKSGSTTAILNVGGMMAATRDASNPLQGLSQIKSLSDKPATIPTWQPAFCGDIDMRIASDGTWFYMNSPIGRKPLYTLFSRVLRREGDDYFLVTPVEKCGIRVDDAPFTAIRMDISGTGQNQVIRFETNCDDTVTVDSDHPLRFAVEQGTDGLKPYVTIRGNLEALVIRSLFYDLVAAGTVVDGWFGVWSSQQFFPMQRADELGAVT
jgi:uncharacterized protein